MLCNDECNKNVLKLLCRVDLEKKEVLFNVVFVVKLKCGIACIQYMHLSMKNQQQKQLVECITFF